MPFSVVTFNLKDFILAPQDVTLPFNAQRIALLSTMLAKADADVIALQEAGSPEGVDALLRALPGHARFAPPMLGPPDRRGIRCVLLSRLPVLAWRHHTSERLELPVFKQGDPGLQGDRLALRRGFVHARLQADSGPVEVLACHLKSKRPLAMLDVNGQPILATTPAARAEDHVRSLLAGLAEALFLRRILDGILAQEPEARVLVAGDLNDVPGSVTLKTITSVGPGALASCADVVPLEHRYSARHGGGYEQLDHILATENLKARLHSAEFLNADLRDPGPFDPNAPPTVESDHAPFIARFA